MAELTEPDAPPTPRDRGLMTADVDAVIPVRFDVPDHMLSIDAFVGTARAIETLVVTLDEGPFAGALAPRIILKPPTQSCFLSEIAVAFGDGGAFLAGLAAFAATDVGKATFKRLDGRYQELKDWAASLAKRAGENRSDDAAPFTRPSTDPKSSSPTTPDPDEGAWEAGRMIEAVVPILLSMPANDFGEELLGTPDGRALGRARNDFFKGARADPNVRAVSFELEGEYAVTRADFPDQIVPVPDEEVEEWQTERERFVVTSPNWDQRDTQRQWKGRDTRRRTRYFVIEDDDFWAKVAADQIASRPKVVIDVQAAYPADSRSKAGTRVLKVLAYSGEELAQPLDQKAVDKLLGRSVPEDEDDDPQADLFDRDPDKRD